MPQKDSLLHTVSQVHTASWSKKGGQCENSTLLAAATQVNRGEVFSPECEPECGAAAGKGNVGMSGARCASLIKENNTEF